MTIILLNDTCKEAFLLVDSYGTSHNNLNDMNYELEKSDWFDLSDLLKMIIFLNWSNNDTVIVYNTIDISYSRIVGYKELNFNTLNKSAYFN
jgi:hypothetical protein